MICGEKDCGRNFHITCGLEHDIYLEYKSRSKGADIIVAMCSEHSKRWFAKQKQQSSNKKK
jgi:NuA3 HAT complex component NTO1